MPLFDTKCLQCGEVVEQYLKRHEEPDICRCGGRMERIIGSRYYINRDLDFVTEDITGDPIRVTSRRQMKRLCEENGVMPKYGKGWV